MNDSSCRGSGWGLPSGAQKMHYFENGRSLCGRWSYSEQCDPETGDRSPADCRDCIRLLLVVTKARTAGFTA